MWTLSSSVGAMLTAASVMISGVVVAGHVHDEAVADPARGAQARLALTTAPISSSVCRLPFISASASPARTSCDRLGRRRMAVRRRRRCGTARFEPCCGHIADARRGPTRIGAIRPSARGFDRAARASSRRRDARPPSAWAAAPCNKRSAADTSRATLPCPRSLRRDDPAPKPAAGRLRRWASSRTSRSGWTATATVVAN